MGPRIQLWGMPLQLQQTNHKCIVLHIHTLLNSVPPPPSPLYVPQICVSPDHTSPPFASGVPLFLALAGAYLPDHIPKCQPCHVPASCCPQPLPSGGQPASAAPLPGAAPRRPVPGALPAAAAYLSKRQQGQPALQPLPAGRGGRL